MVAHFAPEDVACAHIMTELHGNYFAAHAEGLGTPIVGDDIYGTSAERLMLHAETIEFTHPTTGERLRLESKAEF